MDKTKAARVRRRRDKMRAMGLRPVQIWVPDTKAPGFAEEVARQCALINAFDRSPEGREEAAFWDEFADDQLRDLFEELDRLEGKS
jgi:hypothetical protein